MCGTLILEDQNSVNFMIVHHCTLSGFGGDSREKNWSWFLKIKKREIYLLSNAFFFKFNFVESNSIGLILKLLSNLIAKNMNLAYLQIYIKPL